MKAVHIVFLCDNTTKSGDANLTLCCNLAKEFRRQGHDVSILGNCENREDLLEETIDGFPYYRFYYPINRITHQILENYNRTHNLLQMAGALLRHPITAVVDIIRAFTGYNPIERFYVKLLDKINRKHPVDLAIASSGSFYTIHALSKSKIPCMRVGYMMDPYWKNTATGGPRAKKEELFAWKRLDHMVIPTLLKDDYEDPEFAPYRHKRICAEFPGISPIQAAGGPELTDGKVNLLFAGNFYEKIRSPEYLLRLMEAMPEKYCLHILGGVYGSFGPDITEKMERLSRQEKLVLHGAVPGSQAKAAMMRADLLVNIGNAIENQLPSKIFEYFSTGKPVIHIQKIANCPCVGYMERYGNALVVSEEMSPPVVAEQIGAFLLSEQGELSFAQVREKFHACTVQFVAQQFLDLIKLE